MCEFDFGHFNQKSFLDSILDLRIKGHTGLNDDIYRHVKPGQDFIYVRRMRELINTYLWIMNYRYGYDENSKTK